MARPTAPRSLFFAGTSFALLKLVQKLVERNSAEVRHKPNEMSTYVVQTPKVVHGEPSVSAPQELNWTQVMDFVKLELERVDLRVWLAVLLACTLGPLAWSLLQKRDRIEPPEANPCTNAATQTEQEPDTERKDPVTVRYYHYEPAERALLQFGRSKSESVLFNYVPMNFDEAELDDFEGVVAGCTLRDKEPVEELTLREPPAVPPAVEIPPRHDAPEESTNESTRTDDSTEESHSNHQETLNKSLVSLPSLRDSSLERPASAHSQTVLQIQLSPRKTSIGEVQVNPEQAYSQPFSY